MDFGMILLLARGAEPEVQHDDDKWKSPSIDQKSLRASASYLVSDWLRPIRVSLQFLSEIFITGYKLILPWS